MMPAKHSIASQKAKVLYDVPHSGVYSRRGVVARV